MNSTASEGGSKASGGQSESRLQPTIVRHVLTAVSSEIAPLMPITGGTTSLAARPRSVLALLVYHYAQGVLGSHDIECVLRTDPRLRLLCSDEFPDWRQLRRFRRLNHGVVSNCLARVLSDESVLAADSSADAEQRLSEAAILDEIFADE